MPEEPENIIRAATAADAANIAALAIQVWLHTYARDGVREALSAYVLTEFAPERLAAQITDPQRCLLVCERDGHLIGYAAVHLNAPCPQDAAARAELETLYVQAPFLGTGVGVELLEAVSGQCGAEGHPAVWLTVFVENHRAIRFYEKHGFAQIGTTWFEMPGERHKNLVLRRVL